MISLNFKAITQVWRWTTFLLVPLAFALGSILSFELFMAGAFSGWGDRTLAKILYDLTLVVPWIGSIFAGISAMKATHAGNFQAASFRTACFVMSLLLGIGIVATGVFD
ncbi:MAG: hypothetical protein ACKOPG_11885 [Novosphingobium sp.]